MFCFKLLGGDLKFSIGNYLQVGVIAMGYLIHFLARDSS
jgi:hypothetical protein